MEIPTNKKIEKATEEYVAIRDMRMEHTKAEVEKKLILIKALKDAGLTSCEYDGRTVTLTAKENVKVAAGGGEDVGDDIDPDEIELDDENDLEAE